MDQPDARIGRIDGQQKRIDTFDAVEDRKIGSQDISGSPDRLTALYLAKTDALQTEIAEIRSEAAALRNEGKPEWESLERTCGEIEKELLSALEAVDQGITDQEADAFAVRMEELAASLRTPERTASTPVGAENVMGDLLKSTRQDVRSRSAELARDALTHYDEGVIRLVLSRLTLLEALPENLREEVLGSAVLPRRSDVAFQLARGNLADSPNAVLLQNPGPESLTRRAAETAREAYETLLEEQRSTAERVTGEITGLARNTENGESEDDIARTVSFVRKAERDLRDIDRQVAGAAERMQRLRAALDVMRVRTALLDGNTERADRLVLEAKDRYGDALTTFAPLLADALPAAIERADLTEFEEVLYGRRQGDVIAEATDRTAGTPETVDIADQILESRSGLVIGSFRNAKERFGNSIVQNKRGDDATDYFSRYLYVNLTDRNGRTTEAAATEAVRSALAALPPDAEPILLEEIEPARFSELSGGKGLYFRCENGRFDRTILRPDSIGFVDAGGSVHDLAGNIVDLKTDERAAVIERNLQAERAFSLIPYRAPQELRLPSGSRYPDALYSVRTQSGKQIDGVRIAADALALLQAPVPAGKTLVLRRVPRPLELGAPDIVYEGRAGKTIRRVFDADIIRTDDLAYASLDGDVLSVSGIRGTTTETTDVAEARRIREERGHDLLRAINADPAIGEVGRSAADIGRTMGHLQTLLQAGDNGTKREAFVEFARTEAEPTLRTLKDESVLQNAEVALRKLRILKEANLGIALGGVENEIETRISALENYVSVLRNGRLTAMLEGIMDASSFDADTWKNWFARELPVMLSTIAIATAVIVLVIASYGTATPALAAIAAGGAAGGVIGHELGAEGVRLAEQSLNEDVRSGRLAYSRRSKLGAYLEGQNIIDPVTGERVPMQFLKDVAVPYAQDMAMNFVTTYAAVGLGGMAARRLSAMAQNSQWLQACINRNPLLGKISAKLSGIGVQQTPASRSILQRWMGETLDELKDEFIREKGVEVALAQIDRRLGPAAAFVVTVARGFRPLRSPASPGQNLGVFGIPGAATWQEVQSAALAQGLPDVTANPDGSVSIVDGDGYRYTLVAGESTDKRAGTSPSAPAMLTALSAEAAGMNSGDPLMLAAQARNSSRPDALLAFLKTHHLSDTERIAVAETLLGRELASDQKLALLSAHHYGTGNLVDGYVLGERIGKGKRLRRAGFTAAETKLLLDAGVAGNPSFDGGVLEGTDTMTEEEGPISGSEILAWAQAHGIGDEVTFDQAGVLIEQGAANDYVFIIREAGAADVEYCTGGDCYPLSSLGQDTLVGEISALTDGITTARVVLRKPTTVYAIPKEQFRKILQDPSLGSRAEALANERLLQTADFHDRITDYLEERTIEREGGVGNVEAAEALDVQSAIGEMSAAGHGTLTRTFRITGVHRTTKEVRTHTFEARYSRKPDGEYDVTVTDGEAEIPFTFSADGRSASAGYVKAHESAGYGFYGRILRYLLRGTDHVTSNIIEENTVAFLNAEFDDHQGRYEIPHSRLAANSPVVAARRGFISSMPASVGSNIRLDSYRVDRQMEMYLAIATDVERSILRDDESALLKLYGQGRNDVLASLIEFGRQYTLSPEYQALDRETRNLISVQMARVRELAAEYPAG